jgi:hypothetical protein
MRMVKTCLEFWSKENAPVSDVFAVTSPFRNRRTGSRAPSESHATLESVVTCRLKASVTSQTVRAIENAEVRQNLPP